MLDLDSDRRNFYRFNSYKLRKIKVSISCENKKIENGILSDISFKGAKITFNKSKSKNTNILEKNKRVTLKLNEKEILCTIKNVKNGFITTSVHIDFGFNSITAKEIIKNL